MNQHQYDTWTRPFRENPRAGRILGLLNRVLTALGYVAFPLLLIMQAISGAWDEALRTALVAAAGFLSLSIARHILNKPRPYEVLSIEPLIKKDTHGKSFPSRHTFSMFMIAFCWFFWCVPVGILLTIAGIAIAVMRVLGGVHWPRDVVVAFLWALAFAIVGFILIP